MRLLYLHGGGYIAGSVHTHRALAARIAQAAGCVGLVVDYRIAPEDPFPAALEDCIAALGYIAQLRAGRRGRRRPAASSSAATRPAAG